ncbi:MAG: hypothetical protein VX033_00070, partial [Verrucomicrobiota bacterium]|nr:hypothetical protein [Verrucomicrobiota bacterium]
VFQYGNSVTVYYYDDAIGFTSPTWQGIQSEVISRPTPLIVHIQKQEVGFKLWFNATNGQSYRIEYSTNLEDWFTLEDNILTSSDLIERLYSTGDYSQRFFQVVLIDQ